MTDSFTPDEAQRLLQQLAETEDTWSAGAALYGPGGLWDATRKAKLSVIELVLRDGWQGEKRPTDGHLDTLAHADKTYLHFLDSHTIERANWLRLDAERDRLKYHLKLITYIAVPR